MKSLDMGGVITRISWGAMTRRKVRHGDRPSARGRQLLAVVDGQQATAHDLCRVGALVDATARAWRP